MKRIWNLLAGTAVAGALVAAGTAAPSGSFVAVDYAWRANGTDATSLTIVAGETVSFAYPSGTSFHNVDFLGPKPSSCSGMPPRTLPKGWAGECVFTAPGTYPFICDLHEEMTGRVIVTAAEPTATATPTAPGQPPPAATPAPTATPVPAKLSVKVAAKQRGTRVRGSVGVARAGSRVEVTLTARGGRVGRSVKPKAAAGTFRFAVPLKSKVLRGRSSLAVTVTVAVTPPGDAKLTRTVKTRVTPG